MMTMMNILTRRGTGLAGRAMCLTLGLLVLGQPMAALANGLKERETARERFAEAPRSAATPNSTDASSPSPETARPSSPVAAARIPNLNSRLSYDPTIFGVETAEAAPDAEELLLTLNGVNFADGAKVSVDGEEVPATLHDASRLSIIVPKDALPAATPLPRSVQIVNPDGKTASTTWWQTPPQAKKESSSVAPGLPNVPGMPAIPGLPGQGSPQGRSPFPKGMPPGMPNVSGMPGARGADDFQMPRLSTAGAVVSRRAPSLKGGAVTGAVRVLSPEPFTVGTKISSDLYVAGLPSVKLGPKSSHAGIADEGGEAGNPYAVTIADGLVLPGKVRVRAEGYAFPKDITGVAGPAGTRDLVLAGEADVEGIDWTTVRSVTILGDAKEILLPAGHYGLIAVHGKSVVKLGPGNYSFTGLRLGGGATLAATGATVLAIGGGLVLSDARIAGTERTRMNVQGSVSLSGEASVSAWLRAPNGTITITGNAKVRGQIVADRVVMNGGQVIGAGPSEMAVQPVRRPRALKTALVRPGSPAAHVKPGGSPFFNAPVFVKSDDPVVAAANRFAPVSSPQAVSGQRSAISFLKSATPQANSPLSTQHPALSTAVAAAQSGFGPALTRQSPTLNGRVEGSVQVLTGQSFTLNGGSQTTGDILVPGTPTVNLNGNPNFGGVIQGTGSATPTGYTVTISGNASLRNLLTRTNPATMPTVAAPPAPTGTRSVTINSAGQSAGDFATLRNLTLNGNVGQVTIPGGTYGDFIANGGSGFTLGAVGTTTVYNFQNLTLNGNSRIQVNGPIVLNVKNGMNVNGNVGTTGQAGQVQLRVSNGGVTLNGGVNLYGVVTAPSGTVTINGNSLLDGNVAADRLLMNGNSLLRISASNGGGGTPCGTITLSPANLPGARVGLAYSQTLTAAGGSGSYSWSVTSGSLPGGLTLSNAGTLSGTPTTAGTFTFSVTATDGSGCAGLQSYSLAVAACPTIALAPASLPSATVGTVYNQTVTASGGTAPYGFSLVGGALPAGLALSTSGQISGTPTVTGTFAFSVRATDATGCAGTAGYTLTVNQNCGTITLSPATLPQGKVAESYAQSLAATGGNGSYAFSVVSGSLPGGVTLSGAGTLSGSPTTAGTFTFTVRAVDTLGCAGTANYSVVIAAACPSISITPATLPNGRVGQSYNQTLSATGGTAAYSFTVESGALPGGLTLSNGVISGTPTAAGTFSFTVKATDAQGCTGTKSLSITVTACPTITIAPTTLPGGFAGVAYAAQTLSATGGTAPYTFTMESGALPTGFTLTNGLISGTANSAGTFSFTVKATDANGCTGTQALSITVTACPAITVSPNTLPGGFAGVAYAQQRVTASGGVAPYTYAISSGTLPGGVTFSSTGVLLGTPAAAGTFNVTVEATDANGCKGSQSLSLVVATCPTLTFAPESLPGATVGTAYTQNITASAGVAPVTLEVVAGTLPQGFTLSGAGVLSGTPGSAGTSTFTVKATDANGCSATHAFTLTVTNRPAIQITSPADATTTTEATLAVTGTVTDADGDLASVTVNGQPATIANGTWTATVPLTVGANTITVRATDQAGNQTTATVTVTRQEAGAAPQVIFTSPLDGATTFGTTITLEGRAAAIAPNATVTALTVNGANATYDATTKVWRLENVALTDGVNTLTARVTDSNTRSTEARVTVTKRTPVAPTVEFTSPEPNAVVTTESTTVTGRVTPGASDVAVTLTINGAPVALTGNTFSTTVPLNEGTNTVTATVTDALNQTGSSTLSIRSVRTKPNVTLVDLPPTVEAGQTYLIRAEVSDQAGIVSVDFRVNGGSVSTVSTAPFTYSLVIPQTARPGDSFLVTVDARNAGGLVTTVTGQTVIPGTAGLSGYVVDDRTGYPLAGVTVEREGQAVATTSEQGEYRVIGGAVGGRLRFVKPGYVTVERSIGQLSNGASIELLDARLTPADTQSNPLADGGGTARGDGGRIEATFQAGTFTNGADVRVTVISPQGLRNRLPFGWSPVPGAVVDLRAVVGTSNPTAGQLRLTSVPGLAETQGITLVRYDDATGRWMTVIPSLTPGANGALVAEIPGAGQYAFLVADSGSTAPPVAFAGAPLQGTLVFGSDLAGVATTATANPPRALIAPNAQSVISVTSRPVTKLPSGVAVKVTLAETYNLLIEARTDVVERPRQDILLYSYPAATQNAPNTLAAQFVAKPTRTTYTIAQLQSAAIIIGVRAAQTPGGNVIGGDGGTVFGNNGVQLELPAGSVSGSRPVFALSLPLDVFDATLPDGFELAGLAEVDLGGSAIGQSATLSVLSDGRSANRLVVAKVITANGARRLSVVAAATASNGRFRSVTVAGAGLPGIVESGRYAFIRVPVDFGYLTGEVRTGTQTGALAANVLVSADRMPFVSVTKENGQFVVLGSAGEGDAGLNRLDGASLSTDAVGQTSASIAAQGNVVTAGPLVIAPTTFAVTSVTPANGATDIPVNSAIVISFNKPVAVASVTRSNIRVTSGDGQSVVGSLSLDVTRRKVTFTPNSNLANAKTYTVTVSTGVRDFYGNALGAVFSSSFTTQAPVAVSNRLKPEQVRIDYPNDQGFSHVSAPAGAAPVGYTVIVVNNSTQATGAAFVLADGSFSTDILAQVGDELTVIVRSPEGYEYQISQAAYRRPDGFFSVSLNGGSLRSEDGQSTVRIPKGAVRGQMEIRIVPKDPNQLPVALGPGFPSELQFAARLDVETAGQFICDKELTVEAPAPSSLPDGSPFVTFSPAKAPLETGGEIDVWEVLNYGEAGGGKLKTLERPGFFGIRPVAPPQLATLTSPSQNGLTALNLSKGGPKPTPEPQAILITFAVEAIFFYPLVFGSLLRPRYIKGTVSGVTPSGSRPVFGARIRFTGLGHNDGNPFFTPQSGALATRTGIDGKYAMVGFGPPLAPVTVYAGITGPPLLIASQEAVPTSADPFDPGFPTTGGPVAVANIFFPLPGGVSSSENKFKFAVRSTSGDSEVEEQADPLVRTGVIRVNGTVRFVLSSNTSLGQIEAVLRNGSSVVRTWSAGDLNFQNTGAGTYPYVYSGTSQITAEGPYQIVIRFKEAGSTQFKEAVAVFNAQSDVLQCLAGLPSPPSVVFSSPRDGQVDVDVTTRFRVKFSEKVRNLVDPQGNSAILIREEFGERRTFGGILQNIGQPVSNVADEACQVEFTPGVPLQGGKEYSLIVTPTITDLGGNGLDQRPDVEGQQAYTIRFKTFEGLVVNDDSTRVPAETEGIRLSSAYPFVGILSTKFDNSEIKFFDVSQPSLPKKIGTVTLPFRGWDIAMDRQAEQPYRYSTDRNDPREVTSIAVVTTFEPQKDLSRIQLFVIGLDEEWRLDPALASNYRDPATSPLVGIVTVQAPSSLKTVPVTVRIFGKRAYIGCMPYRGVIVVDLQKAIFEYWKTAKAGISPYGEVFSNIRILRGDYFGTDTKVQSAYFGRSLGNEGSPASTLSTIEQSVVGKSFQDIGTNRVSPLGQMPVTYVTDPVRQRLIALGFPTVLDGTNGLIDGNGPSENGPLPSNGINDQGLPPDTPVGYRLDDRLLAYTKVNGGATTVRAVSSLRSGTTTQDILVVLGNGRLNTFDASQPTDSNVYIKPRLIASRSFSELGITDSTSLGSTMEIEGTLAYVAAGDKIYGIDFSDPANLRLVSQVTTGGSITSLAVENGLIFSLSNSYSGTPLPDDGLKVSIIRPSVQLLVNGISSDAEDFCANPVLKERKDNTEFVRQKARVFFQVYGRHKANSARVVIQKEVTNNQGQRVWTDFASLDATLLQGQSSGTRTTEGFVIWDCLNLQLLPADQYRARLILDSGSPDEFVTDPEPIVFSELIAQFVPTIRTRVHNKEKTLAKIEVPRFGFVLGGNATKITFQIDPDGPSRRDPKVYIPGVGQPFAAQFGYNTKGPECNGNLGPTTDELNKWGLGLKPGQYPVKLTVEANVGTDVPLVQTVEYTLIISDSDTKTKGPGLTMVGPVILNNGVLALSHPDLMVPERGAGITLARNHISTNDSGLGDFGNGWNHNFHIQLIFEGDRVPLSTGDTGCAAGSTSNQMGVYRIDGGEGSGITFTVSDPSKTEFQADSPYNGKLVKNSDGTFTFVSKTGNKYIFSGAPNISYAGEGPNLVGIEDPAGNRQSLDYDEQGFLSRIIGSSFTRELLIEYEDTGNVYGGLTFPLVDGRVRVCSPRKRPFAGIANQFTRNEIKKARRIKSVKLVMSADPQHPMAQVDYAYDSNNNLIAAIRKGNPSGNRGVETADEGWTYTYGQENVQKLLNRVKSFTSPERIKTEFTYFVDEAATPDLPVQQVAIGGGTTPSTIGFEYLYETASGGVKFVKSVTVTDSRSIPTKYEFKPFYPNLLRVIQQTKINGSFVQVSEVVFDDKGQKVKEIDGEERESAFSYDEKGNIKSQVTGGKTFLGFRFFTPVITQSIEEYDSRFSAPTKVKDPLGRVTSIVYAPNGKPAIITDPNQVKMTLTYADNGDLEIGTDKQGNQTTFSEYDAYGNPGKISQSVKQGENVPLDNVSITLTHDPAMGWETRRTGNTSPTVTFVHDAFGRVTKETVSGTNEREGFIRETEYFPGGLTKSVKVTTGGERESKASYEYDSQARLVKITEEATGAPTYVQTFEYDPTGNITAHVDRRGVRTEFEYDDLNFVKTVRVKARETEETEVDAATTIVNDKIGNPVSVTDMYGHSVTLQYDDFHRLRERTQTVTDSEGLTKEYTESFGYDDLGSLTNKTDRDGRETKFWYQDGLNRVTKIQDAEGRITTFSYDDSKGLTTVIDPFGLVMTKQVDGLDRPYLITRQGTTRVSGEDTSVQYSVNIRRFQLTEIQTGPRPGQQVTMVKSPFGETVRVVMKLNDNHEAEVVNKYDGFGGLVSRTDPRGFETTFVTDPFGRVLSITHPSDENTPVQQEILTYDGSSKLLTHQIRRDQGRVIFRTVSYDHLERMKSLKVEGLGQAIWVSRMSYKDSEKKEETKDARGNVTVTYRDGLRRVIRTVDPAERVTRFFYSGENLAKVTNARGFTTQFQYDGIDRPLVMADPLTFSTCFDYQENGRTVVVTNRNGEKRTAKLDAFGRTIEASDEIGLLGRSEYDASDNPTKVQDGEGRTVQMVYDLANRPVKRIYPETEDGQQIETFDYDLSGNLIDAFDGLSRVGTPNAGHILKTYDALNRPLTVTNGIENQKIKYSYFADGLLRRVMLPKGEAYKTDYDYNVLGSLNRVIDADDKIWEFQFDDNQNPTGMTDPLNRQTTYNIHPKLNRVESVVQPNNRVTSFTYDELDNVRTVTNPLNQVTERKYDALNRVYEIDYRSFGTSVEGVTQQNFGYKPEGEVLLVTEFYNDQVLGNGLLRLYGFGYDKRGRLTAEERLNGMEGRSRAVTYEYDNSDRVTLVRDLISNRFDTSGRETRRLYDAAGRLSSVKVGGVERARYGYFVNGLLKEMVYGDGSKTTYAYDPANRVKTIESSVRGQAAQGFTYEYDANGNRTGETLTRNGQSFRGGTFTYDLLDRVLTAEYTGRSYAWTYDAVGNRLTEDVTDRTGLTTTNRNRIFSYNESNQLKQVTESGQVKAVFDYDDAGNVVTATENGVTTGYAYDLRQQLLRATRQQTNGPPSVVGDYEYDYAKRRIGRNGIWSVYGGSDLMSEWAAGPDQTAPLNTYVQGHELIESSREGKSFGDSQGSVTLTENRTEKFTEYGAFGEVLSTDATQSGHGYTGQFYDAETGLQPLGNGERYYSSEYGRFLQEDSFAGLPNMPQSLNRYAYAHGNPLKYTDPSGNFILNFFTIPLTLYAIYKGVESFITNIKEGNYFEATIDAIGVALDVAGLIGQIPGPIGTALKACRWATVAIAAGRVIVGGYRFYQGAKATYELIEYGDYKRAFLVGGLTAIQGVFLASHVKELFRVTGATQYLRTVSLAENKQLPGTEQKQLTDGPKTYLLGDGSGGGQNGDGGSALARVENGAGSLTEVSENRSASAESLGLTHFENFARGGSSAGFSAVSSTQTLAKFNGPMSALGRVSHSQQAIELVKEAATAAGINDIYTLVDEIKISPYGSSFYVDEFTGLRYLEIGSSALRRTIAGKLLEASHEIVHAEQWAKILEKNNGDLNKSYDEFFNQRPFGSWLYAHDETVAETLARIRVSKFLDGMSRHQAALSRFYTRGWRDAYYSDRAIKNLPSSRF